MLKSFIISIVALVSIVSTANDKWAIQFTYPRYLTTWKAGNRYNVEWSTDVGGNEIPKDARGKLVLTSVYPDPYADLFMEANDFDFPLSDGSVEVYIPQGVLNKKSYYLYFISDDVNSSLPLDKSKPFAIVSNRRF
ncbi:hypothetical protein BDF14DRAFT_1826437 [Spinellus fusiger]|nr:hypothetical protein BDF14DRAFT_1826437 [Spinellus fusiger]